jgi:hypothetical protein
MFEADVVVHRVAKPLLTAQVPLRRLYAHMAKEKLDLLKIVGRNLLDTEPLREIPNHVPDDFFGYSVLQKCTGKEVRWPN